MDRNDKYIGKKLDGRYEIQELIGVGGMANVYKAHDRAANRTVAVKILRDEYLSNEELLRRFKNESKAIAVLSHPNIVKVYDVIFADKVYAIVMEYIDGITLKEYIEQQHVLKWKEAVHFTVQILRALQHAPEFLETLVKFLKTEPACLEKLAVDLAYAYGLPKPGEGSGPAPDAFHEELFALLRPIWQAHWQKAREQNAKEAATPGRIYAVIVGLSAFIAMLATQDAFHPALRLLLAFLGGAAGVAVMLLAQRMQARGWLSSTAVLLLRLLQLFFLALFFFGVGPASAAGLLACFVAAALPGRKWYFRQSKQTRFALTAACAVLSVIWVPVSFVVMPSITDDVAFCAIFSWCVLPLAFIRCIVSNCRFYKLAARYGL